MIEAPEWLDRDLAKRFDAMQKEYRRESIHIVREGFIWSGRLSALLDEQDAILNEQWRRDDRRIAVRFGLCALVLVAIFVIVGLRRGVL